MRCAPAALALALALPLPSLAGAVMVQPGETLSEIADRLGVSVQRLIEVNKIKDPDHLEAGTQLRLPPGVSSRTSSGGKDPATGTVTVGQGETLSDIADRHGISMTTLIALNSISDPDHVEAGQVLKLRGKKPGSTTPPGAHATTYSYQPGASEHVVRKGESLSAIARGYGVPVGRLIALNAITNPDSVHAGSTLRLKGNPPASAPAAQAPVTRAPSSQASPAKAFPAQASPAKASQAQASPAQVRQPRPVAAATTVAAAPRPATAPVQQAATGRSDWRTYGPLHVDWTSWQPMGGSMVAAVVNPRGETLYTAINCGARKINSTSPSGQWGIWNDPGSDPEKKLVSDFCSRRNG